MCYKQSVELCVGAKMSTAAGTVTDLTLSQLQASQSATRARVSGSSGFPFSMLPNGVSIRRSDDPVWVSAPDGLRLAGKAVAAAVTVESSLNALQSLAAIARDGGVSGNVPDQSRLNLQAEVQRLVRDIDKAAAKASQGNANLVASGGRDARISTTLGGQIIAVVQALDSTGLGITGLDLTSDSGAADAAHRISQAIANAGARSQRLQSLSRALGGQSAFSSDINTVLSQSVVGGGTLRTYGSTAGSGSASVARGSLANVRT
jgi:hypothetical protein